MRTIAFLTQKGGTGKTTLAVSLAVAAAHAGERVIALDLDPQASLLRWAKYREATNAPNTIVIEPLENERLPHLRAILEGFAGVGFTLAIFDTAGSDSVAARFIREAADICLLPTRPTRLDVAATAATFRAVFLAKRKVALVLNQCPPIRRSSRTSEAAKGLTSEIWQNRRYRRVWISRMPWPKDSVSPNTLGRAGPRRKSRRSGAGHAPRLKGPRVKRSSIITLVDRRPHKLNGRGPVLRFCV